MVHAWSTGWSTSWSTVDRDLHGVNGSDSKPARFTDPSHADHDGCLREPRGPGECHGHGSDATRTVADPAVRHEELKRRRHPARSLRGAVPSICRHVRTRGPPRPRRCRGNARHSAYGRPCRREDPASHPDHRCIEEGRAVTTPPVAVPFAFLGRVSTEDQQDPESSRAWQLGRAKALIEPHGGEIVAELLRRRSEPIPAVAAPAEGQRTAGRARRSGPRLRRGRHRRTASRLLRQPVRADLPAVRPLRRAAVGARGRRPARPGQRGPRPGHERLRRHEQGRTQPDQGPGPHRHGIADRSRAVPRRAPAVRVQAADLGAHPNPARPPTASGSTDWSRTRHRGSCAGSSTSSSRQAVCYVIAEGLTRDGIACPSAHDPARNRHRSGIAWSKSAIRAILTNPRYTGRQVWNTQRTDEVLLDVDDVALGHTTVQRWNAERSGSSPTRSPTRPLIDDDTFEHAQELLRTSANSSRRARRTRHPYLFRSLIICGVCLRRMQGQHSHGSVYYRCRYPQEYALANRVEHPRNVIMREDVLIGPLDNWIAGLFDPEHRATTVAAMATAEAPELSPSDHRINSLLADCNRRLLQYRRALDTGADPAVVTGWINETQTERPASSANSAPRAAWLGFPSDDRRCERRADQLFSDVTGALQWGLR